MAIEASHVWNITEPGRKLLPRSTDTADYLLVESSPRLCADFIRVIVSTYQFLGHVREEWAQQALTVKFISSCQEIQ